MMQILDSCVTNQKLNVEMLKFADFYGDKMIPIYYNKNVMI